MAAYAQTAPVEHQAHDQVVRVPNEFALGDEALVFQDSAGRVILEPIF